MVDAIANSLMLIVTRSASANAVLTILFKLMLMKVPKTFLTITLTLMQKPSLMLLPTKQLTLALIFLPTQTRLLFEIAYNLPRYLLSY